MKPLARIVVWTAICVALMFGLWYSEKVRAADYGVTVLEAQCDEAECIVSRDLLMRLIETNQKIGMELLAEKASKTKRCAELHPVKLWQQRSVCDVHPELCWQYTSVYIPVEAR